MLLICLFLDVIISIPVPYLSKYLIDDVLIGEKYTQVNNYLVMIFLIVIFQIFIGRLSIKIAANFFQQFLFKIRERIFKNSLYVSDIRKDSLSTVILNDTEMYVSSIELIISTVVKNSITVVAYMIIMINLNWKLSIIIFSFVPIYTIWIVYISSKLKIFSERQQQIKDELIAAVNNANSNTEVISIYKFSSKILQNFTSLIKKSKNLNVRTSIYHNFVNIIAGVIVTIASVLPFAIGVSYVAKGEMTIGSLVVFNSYGGLVFSPITALISIISTITISKVYKSRIEYFTLTEGFLEQKIDLEINEVLLNKVDIYGKNSSILQNIFLNLKSGKWVRIHGANGSGKTLFLKTISQLYDNYTGEIFVKDTDNNLIKLVDNVCLSPRQVLYVSNTQNFPLNNLYEELTTQNNLTEQEILNLFKVVELSLKTLFQKDNLNYFVDILEEYSTGELQKIRLARALARKPLFLILDEILSNIEEMQCIRILNNIKENYPTMSLIIVEHHFTDNFPFDIELMIKESRIQFI